MLIHLTLWWIWLRQSAPTLASATVGARADSAGPARRDAPVSLAMLAAIRRAAAIDSPTNCVSVMMVDLKRAFAA